jgi:hypothetical protein
MKRSLPALALASAFSFVSLSTTSAHAAPASPPPPAWSLPPLPPPSAWPRLDVLFPPPAQPGGLPSAAAPIDLGPIFAQLQQAQVQMAQCPPIEIAPGIRIPLPCTPLPPRPAPDPREPDIARPAFLAPAVDLRAAGLDGPVRDQGPVGVCWAFALTTAMESSLRRAGRADRLSPLHVIAADTWSSLWSTKSAPEPITQEHLWPYEPVKACRFERGRDACESTLGVRTESWQSDPHLVMERNAARSTGTVRAVRTSSLKEPIREADVAAVLSTGRPVEMALEIDSRAWGWSGMQGGRLPPYAVADRGGHEVVIVGYRPVGATREFLIHNSWGTKWGEGGYAWISAAELERHALSAMIVEAR